MDVPFSTTHYTIEGRRPNLGEEVATFLIGSVLPHAITKDGESRLLMQSSSQTLLGPVFFEFIQRNDDGFGKGNFKAQFESMERHQLNLGVITDE
jgi:4-hydroxyphenylpyruvate dioxygenase